MAFDIVTGIVASKRKSQGSGAGSLSDRAPCSAVGRWRYGSMGFAINTRGCGSGTDMQSSPPGHRALVRLNNHSRDPFHRHRHRLHSDVTVAVPRSPRSMPLGWRLGSENENRGYCGSQGSHGVKATRGLSPSRMPEKCLSTTYLSIFTPTPPTPLLLA
jgi:hypothetical protein